MQFRHLAIIYRKKAALFYLLTIFDIFTLDNEKRLFRAAYRAKIGIYDPPDGGLRGMAVCVYRMTEKTEDAYEQIRILFHQRQPGRGGIPLPRPGTPDSCQPPGAVPCRPGRSLS